MSNSRRFECFHLPPTRLCAIPFLHELSKCEHTSEGYLSLYLFVSLITAPHPTFLWSIGPTLSSIQIFKHKALSSPSAWDASSPLLQIRGFSPLSVMSRSPFLFSLMGWVKYTRFFKSMIELKHLARELLYASGVNCGTIIFRNSYFTFLQFS